MFYIDHAKMSARKFNCNLEDTVKIHKVIDSTKLFFPQWQHRMFSHNMWFVGVLVELIGDTVPNTKTGKEISVRDIAIEHLKEDFSGKAPDLKDWLNCIKFETNEKWINQPDRKEMRWLKEHS
jgi:hypothetical protein